MEVDRLERAEATAGAWAIAPAARAERRTTAIFAKCPRAGAVKTRLCPPLDPQEAALLAEAMLADLIDRFARTAGFRTVVCYAPAAEEDWFRARFPCPTALVAQEGPDLGRRLASFFAREDARDPQGSRVVVGSDAPLVSAADVLTAHELLESGADLVLGPDAGGGYYLVGMRRPEPRLFTDVEMSTAGMCAATIALAERLGLRVELLPQGYDVDEEADLWRLREDLRSAVGKPDPDFPRRTAELLEELLDR